MRSQYARAEQKPSECINRTEELRETINAFHQSSTRNKVLALAAKNTPISTISRYVGVSVQYVTQVIADPMDLQSIEFGTSQQQSA